MQLAELERSTVDAVQRSSSCNTRYIELGVTLSVLLPRRNLELSRCVCNRAECILLQHIEREGEGIHGKVSEDMVGPHIAVYMGPVRLPPLFTLLASGPGGVCYSAWRTGRAAILRGYT